jgi:hypothetical protein
VGSEGGEGVREGEGVVGRTYCIQLKNDDIIVVVDDLRRMDATLLTGTRPDAHWQLVHVVKRQCNRCRRRSASHGCHVADWYTTRCLLATCLCGDGHSWPLIDGVGGRSWTIVGGGWALVVLGRCIHSSMVVGACHPAKGVLVYVGAGGVEKDVCRGLFVNVALLP